MNVETVALWLGGADRLEELFQDGVEPSDFVLGGMQVLGQLITVGGREFLELAFE